jgi:hypothetical protein
MTLWHDLLPLLAQQMPVETPPPTGDKLLLLGGSAAAVAVLFVGWYVLKLVGRKPETQSATAPNLRLDVSSLAGEGPPSGKPYLEFYSVPVRLAAIVLAPVGREGQLPRNEDLPLVMEAILPGLMKVLTAHQPQFLRWPSQLSTQGFAQAFFNKVPLPGDRGRGTPWCSIAGKVELPTGQFLVGLVCRSADANSLSEVTTRHAAGWPDVIRVKE